MAGEIRHRRALGSRSGGPRVTGDRGGPGGLVGRVVDLEPGVGEPSERHRDQDKQEQQRGHEDQLDRGAALLPAPSPRDHGPAPGGLNRSTGPLAVACTGRCRNGMTVSASPVTVTVVVFAPLATRTEGCTKTLWPS